MVRVHHGSPYNIIWLFMSELILIIVLGGLIYYAIFCYNNSLKLQQTAISSKSNVSSYIKRMESVFEKVLQETGKGSEFEKDVLKSITKIRKLGFENPNLVRTKIQDEIFRFENYPDMKSQVLREKYQNEVASLEREIQDSTEIYNSDALYYNTFVTSFPANLFCKFFGRKVLQYID